jgi:hypothetical protein
MLWDRAEANGYAQHLTDEPYEDTPEHRVLMHVAFGDHQVSQFAAAVEARTIGARLHCPASADGRLPGPDPYWGLECIDDDTYDGSAMVIWDSGSPPPPLPNVPPRDGHDPHEDPRADADARRQKAEFLDDDGEYVDVCDGASCRAEPTG